MDAVLPPSRMVFCCEIVHINIVGFGCTSAKICDDMLWHNQCTWTLFCEWQVLGDLPIVGYIHTDNILIPISLNLSSKKRGEGSVLFLSQAATNRPEVTIHQLLDLQQKT